MEICPYNLTDIFLTAMEYGRKKHPCQICFLSIFGWEDLTSLPVPESQQGLRRNLSTVRGNPLNDGSMTRCFH